eukprot:2784436-Pyramimonas_sp.AAC.1
MVAKRWRSLRDAGESKKPMDSQELLGVEFREYHVRDRAEFHGKQGPQQSPFDISIGAGYN